MIKKIITKRFLLALIMSAGTYIAIAQATIVQHTVERGETLASIANRYGTTEAKIIESNPNADKFIYIGMKLNIPVVKVNNANNNAESTPITGPSQTAVLQPQKKDNHSSYTDFEHWSPDFEIAYGFLKKPQGIHGNSYSYSFTVGCDYYFTRSFFIGGRIGYNSSNYNLRESNIQSQTNSHFISLPIETGYKFHLYTDKVTLIPYTGIGLNYCVKAKLEQKIGSEKVKTDLKRGGDIAANARIGAKVQLWGFNIGCSYIMPLNKNQKNFFGKDPYWSVSIGLL